MTTGRFKSEADTLAQKYVTKQLLSGLDHSITSVLRVVASWHTDNFEQNVQGKPVPRALTSERSGLARRKSTLV